VEPCVVCDVPDPREYRQGHEKGVDPPPVVDFCAIDEHLEDVISDRPDVSIVTYALCRGLGQIQLGESLAARHIIGCIMLH